MSRNIQPTRKLRPVVINYCVVGKACIFMKGVSQL